MASKVYRDLIGSSQTNTETTFGAEAVRRVFVRVDDTDGFANTTLLGKAIEKAVDGQFYHPDDPSLPLQRANAQQIGKNTCEVTLEYKRRNSTSGPLDVPAPGGVVYQSRARVASKQYHKGIGGEWFDSTAIDVDDNTIAKDRNKPPKPRPFPIAEEDIIVPVILNQYQFGSLQSAKNDIGKTNSNVLKFAGHTFAAGTLMLSGIDVDWQSQQVLGGQTAYVSWGGNTTGVNAALVFVVQYKFKYRPGGHQEEVVYWDTSGTPDQWAVQSVNIYQSTNMSGYPI